MRTTFAWTFWSSLVKPAGVTIQCARDRFVERFRTPLEFASKDALPRWSPATFKDSTRRLANVIDVGAVVLDFDQRTDVARLIDAFRPFAGFLHTTWSSTPEAPRCRVVLFVDRRMSVDEYARVWRVGAMRAERAGQEVDHAARDASRAWAVGGVPRGAPYLFERLTGDLVDVGAALAVIPAKEPTLFAAREETRADIVDRARRWLAHVDPAISGSGGHRATYRAALGLVRGFELDPQTALRLLTEEFNPRCQPPWNRSDLVHKVKDALRSRVAPGWLRDAPRRCA